MGSATSSILKPQELTEFRKLNTSVEHIEIPARPESRTTTDKKGLIAFGITIIVFIAFLTYSLSKSDIRRLTHDFDHCGNLCGYNNSQIEDVPCSGKNYENKPFSNIEGSLEESESVVSYEFARCVATCPSDKLQSIWGDCEPIDVKNLEIPAGSRISSSKPDMDITWEYCRTNWWKFIISMIITIALSVFVLFLLRYCPGVVVWTVLGLCMVVLVAFSGVLWVGYFTADNLTKEGEKALLIGSIALTVFTIIIVILFIFLFKKVRLVIQLIKEATKAIFAMPLMMAVPVFLTLLELIILIAAITSTLWLMTAADLKKYRDDWYQYEMNGAQVFTVAFNFIMMFWSMQFIAGIQYMVIAGSVAAWYFAKNKEYLDSPISTSFFNAMKFHLGTVAFGSLIITLVAIIKSLVQSITKNDKMKIFLECCCENVEAFFKFLSKNAYIETAIHGQSFLRSGRRAAKLLLTNAVSLIAVNSVGDFVLGMIQFMLIVITTAISVALWKDGNDWWLPSLICLLINIIIVSITFGIFETTIDTLFICFCEDKVINDGMSKPYYMSRGLMEFVENSKKIYGKQELQ